jgi:hypothetical protein
MPWVRFLKSWHWKINTNQIKAFQEGCTVLVTTGCAASAVAAGAAERTAKPKQDDDGSRETS